MPIILQSLTDPAWTTLAARIASLTPVAVLTGAGISAESGLPTFRASGLWETFRVEEVATTEAFERDPLHVWRFYNFRRTQVAAASPNAAHRAVADLERSRGDAFTLITQNVDGLHQAAGSSRVLELHGSIRRTRCVDCGRATESLEPLGDVPQCECGGRLRPDVVWFGESLPAAALLAAHRAFDRAGLLLVVGTSAVVYPAAGLIAQARKKGSYIIEINPDETDATRLADAVLRGPAAEMLPRLVTLLQSTV